MADAVTAVAIIAVAITTTIAVTISSDFTRSLSLPLFYSVCVDVSLIVSPSHHRLEIMFQSQCIP